ncbi:MAG: TonB family protein [Desulfomonilia bacterium]
MTRRPVACFAVSALLHILALMIPFTLMTLPIHPLSMQKDSFMVDLVAAPSQNSTSLEQQAGPQAAPQVKEEAGKQEAESGSGVSFKADRTVGTSYLDLLKARIFLVWKYPDEAIQKGQEGRVSISFELNSNGELIDISILESSGSSSLDTASTAAVKQASPFGPLPKDISDKPLRITGQFCYVLD